MSWKLILAPLLAVAVLGAATPWSAARPLSQSQIALIEQQIGPAFEQQDAAALLQSVTGLAAHLDAEGVQEAENRLSDRKWPGLGELLLAARMANVQRGGDFMAPRPTPNELVLLLPFLRQELAAAIDQTNNLPALADPAPKPDGWNGYEAAFWALKQAGGLLDSALFASDQAARLKRLASRVRRSSLTQEQLAALDADYRPLRDQLISLQRKIHERAVQLRLDRLSAAVGVLEKSSDLKDRLVAAHFVDVDGAALLDIFPKPKNANQAPPAPRFATDQLNDPELPNTVQLQVGRGRELAGDLIGKSRLLYAGIWWWLRGRYGKGTEFFGLIKDKTALKSPAALTQVAMPPRIPNPADPSSLASRGGATEAGSDRRHHYIWAWEERTVKVRRTVIEERGSGLGNSGLGEGKSIHIESDKSWGRYIVPEGAAARTPQVLASGQIHPWLGMRSSRYSSAYTGPYHDIEDRIFDRETTLTQKYYPKQRPDVVKRIVGFVEYGNALENLDQLVRTCSRDELKAANQLVSERDELAIYTNLSRKWQRGPSSLVESPRGPNDDFERRGLAWIMGLARVELAAMLAGFANQKDAFALVLQTPFGADEYREFVQDGMRTHLWTLRQDPAIQAILSGKATGRRWQAQVYDSKPGPNHLVLVRSDVNRLIRYYRRVYVAGEFLKASRGLGGNTYSSAQLAEMKAGRDELEGMLVGLFNTIRSQLGTNVNVKQQPWYHGDFDEADLQRRLIETLKQRGIDPNSILKP